ncbi:MAG: hypothetical protein AAB382_12480 [Chloroflexota bacterium]
MDIVHVLPFLSTGIMLVFTGAVFGRYFLRHRRPHLLLWGIGLALYAIGTFTEAYLAVSWSPLMLRLWYLCGAMLTAAWLGQGTMYLLIRKPGIAHALTALLVAASVVAIGGIFTAPLDASAFRLGVPISSQYRDILARSGLVVLLTVWLNIYGTVGLIGGALWSAYLFWRKRVLPNRVLGNVFIAVGAFFPASAGTFIKLGLADWLYLSELLGAALMFVGFWIATQPQPAEKSATATMAA